MDAREKVMNEIREEALAMLRKITVVVANDDDPDDREVDPESSLNLAKEMLCDLLSELEDEEIEALRREFHIRVLDAA